MKLRRAAPASLILVAIVLMVGMAIISNALFGGLATAVEKSRFDSMEAILAFNLRSAGDKALARAELIASMSTTRRLVAARDREGLLKEYGPTFQTQHEKYGIDQMQFHVAPGTSLLRLQAPDQHSDDLTTFRTMVVAVNRDQVPRAGIEIARTGPAIFGVVPVLDLEGKAVGSFEAGIDISALLDNLKSAYNLELALFVDEQQLRDVAPGLGADVFDEQKRVGRYLRYYTTDGKLLRELVDGKDLDAMEEPRRYVRAAAGVTFGVVLVPLRDQSGARVGVMALASDFSASRAAAGRSITSQALLALFGIILMAGAILVVLRGFLLRPLSQVSARFEALANAEPDPGGGPTELYCEEIQTLSQQHDKLREKIAPTEPPSDEPGERS